MGGCGTVSFSWTDYETTLVVRPTLRVPMYFVASLLAGSTIDPAAGIAASIIIVDDGVSLLGLRV